MDASTLKDIATIVGGFVAVAALVKAVIEYSRMVTTKRAEFFLDMRRRLKETQTLKDLCDLVEHDDPELASMPLKEKLHLTGFFEEIALMMNSGLIRKEVAHYMFGYYALRCWHSSNFWKGLKRDAPYWSLLRDFVRELEVMEKKLIELQKSESQKPGILSGLFARFRKGTSMRRIKLPKVYRL